MLVQIEKKVKEYGADNVIELITECMANNWKGIIWEKIKKEKQSEMPNWWDKEFKERERTDEEQKQLEELIRGY